MYSNALAKNPLLFCGVLGFTGATCSKYSTLHISHLHLSIRVYSILRSVLVSRCMEQPCQLSMSL